MTLKEIKGVLKGALNSEWIMLETESTKRHYLKELAQVKTPQELEDFIGDLLNDSELISDEVGVLEDMTDELSALLD